jgi:hypothetical protein
MRTEPTQLTKNIIDKLYKHNMLVYIKTLPENIVDSKNRNLVEYCVHNDNKKYRDFLKILLRLYEYLIESEVSEDSSDSELDPVMSSLVDYCAYENNTDLLEYMLDQERITLNQINEDCLYQLMKYGETDILNRVFDLPDTVYDLHLLDECVEHKRWDLVPKLLPHIRKDRYKCCDKRHAYNSHEELYIHDIYSRCILSGNLEILKLIYEWFDADFGYDNMYKARSKNSSKILEYIKKEGYRLNKHERDVVYNTINCDPSEGDVRINLRRKYPIMWADAGDIDLDGYGGFADMERVKHDYLLRYL